MNINSSRNALLRARNLRSAKRSRTSRILSSRTTGSSSNTGSAKRTSSSSYTAATPSKQIAMYEKIEKSANDIQGNVKNMNALGRMTYTDDEAGEKAREKGRETLVADIKDFVSDFNTVHGALTDIAGSANLALKKTLDSVVTADAGALKEIGITVSKSGELSIDEKVLKDADPGKVEALFAQDGSFADKISDKMKAIETSASGSLTTLNKLYGATSTYNKYGTGSYYDNNSNIYNGKYYGSGSWYF